MNKIITHFKQTCRSYSLTTGEIRIICEADDVTKTLVIATQYFIYKFVVEDSPIKQVIEFQSLEVQLALSQMEPMKEEITHVKPTEQLVP